MREAELLAINERVTALFNPAELSEGEPGDFDGLLFETMRECQDDELARLQAQRAEIEAKREAELLAILDAGPIDPAALTFMSTAQRKRAQAGIDALIDYLDAVEPDADLEPTMGVVMAGHMDECEPDADDEPSLGATCFGSLWQDLWSRGDRRDLEEQCEDEGACIQSQPHDAEPDEHSLGSLDRIMDQERWAEGGCPWGGGDLELEDEHGGDILDQPEVDYA